MERTGQPKRIKNQLLDKALKANNRKNLSTNSQNEKSRSTSRKSIEESYIKGKKKGHIHFE